MTKYYMTIAADAELKHPKKTNAELTKEFLNSVFAGVYGVKFLSETHDEAVANLKPGAVGQVLTVTIEDYLEDVPNG